MTMMKLWTPVRRELWEYKVGLLLIPAAVALLLVLSVLYMAVVYGYEGSFNGANLIEFRGEENIVSDFSNHAQVAAINSSMKDVFIGYFALAATVLMLIPVAMALLVYGHSCLFDDRRNREVLFWRSMPVSETQNVLTKLFVMTVVAPSVIFVLALVSVLAVWLIDACSFFLVEQWQPISILASLSELFAIYGALLFYVAMLFPMFSWIIFSSALARKSPFMVSSLVPVLLVAVDAMANAYLYIDLHIVTSFKRYIDFLDDVMAKRELPVTADLVGSFSVAILISGILILAAIWLRNNRYEI